MATKSGYNAHTEPLFHKLNTLRLTENNLLSCSKLAFSVIGKVAPKDLNNGTITLDEIGN
jgi:hypothetical protein